jgi:hypothetical protein
VAVQVVSATASSYSCAHGAATGSKTNRPAVMRKNMNRALEEFLSGSASSPSTPSSAGSDVVYIGEDVEHGGYYLVTEGLKKKYSTLLFPFASNVLFFLACSPPPSL